MNPSQPTHDSDDRREPTDASMPSREAHPPADRLPTGLVYAEDYKAHVTGHGHPEAPERLDAIVAALAPERLGFEPTPSKPRRATRSQILYCHGAAFHDGVAREIELGASMLSTGDTTACWQSYEVALLAAGGVMVGVDAVLAGEVESVFCPVRPPGHHARPAQAMGFCIFNNVAIAARYAQFEHNVGKVLIVDWDVHHGNGTQDIFYDDPSVLFFSTHLSPHFPGTGSAEEAGHGPGEGTTINCPLRVGAGRDEVFRAFEEKLVPAADRFEPELVFVSAGFDSMAGDPLGGMRLSDQDFADLTEMVLDISRRHTGRGVVSVLEGGYVLSDLARATAAHVRALDGKGAGQ